MDGPEHGWDGVGPRGHAPSYPCSEHVTLRFRPCPCPSTRDTSRPDSMADMIADLRWRGLVHQTTDDAFLPGWLNGGCRTLYAGFDPTADSLHVGSLLPLMTLRRFQRAGHRPIAVVGGATGMIGDPSGKSEERNLLSAETLAANVAGLKQQMLRFLDFEEGSVGGDSCRHTSPDVGSSTRPSPTGVGSDRQGATAILVNNYDWMRDYSYLAFLRDVG